MTREEAITRLHWLKRELIKGTDMNEPIDMAIEALQDDVVRCKDCLHANECHKSVQYTRHELNTVTIGYSPIEWCSRGERKGGDDE